MEKLRCPNCGSLRIIMDPLTGTLVCQDCGTVIDDAPIDDYAMHPRGIHWRLRRLKVNQVLYKVDTSGWGNRPDPKDPIKIIPKYIIKIASNIPKWIPIKYRTRIALAYYIYERSEGNSKNRALRIAALKSRVSSKTIERILRQYRDWIEDEIRRVARA